MPAFFEGYNQRDVRSKTFVSNSLGTADIDAYRQGVELSQEKHFQQGMVKIWSGLPGHSMGTIDLGQRDDDIFPERTSFVEVSKFSPITYLTNGYRNEVIVVDSPISTNEVGMDGIIEPLSIRRPASFTSVDIPFEPRSVKAGLESGNSDFFSQSDVIVSLIKPTDANVKTTHYEDNVDMAGRTPTNMGFWPKPRGIIVPFDDAQFRDGNQISAWMDRSFIIRVNAMKPASDRYGAPREGVVDRFPATSLISTAGLMTDYERDWIHPIGGGYERRGFGIPGNGPSGGTNETMDLSTLNLVAWWTNADANYTIGAQGVAQSQWTGTASAGVSGTNHQTVAIGVVDSRRPTFSVPYNGRRGLHFPCPDTTIVSTEIRTVGTGTEMINTTSTTWRTDQTWGWIVLQVQLLVPNPTNTALGIDNFINSSGVSPNAAQPWTYPAPISDQSQFITPVAMKTTTSSNYYHWDTAVRETSSMTLVPDTSLQIIQWKREGTTLSVRYNKGAWQTSSTTGTLSNVDPNTTPVRFQVIMGRNSTAGTGRYFTGDILDVGMAGPITQAPFTMPTQTQFDIIANTLAQMYGISI